jgi:hypothetical protein
MAGLSAEAAGPRVVVRAEAAPDAFDAALVCGVLQVRWRRQLTVSNDMASGLVDRVDALCPAVCPPMLVVLNEMVSLSRGALQHFARGLNISSLALVGTSVVDKTIAEYFIRVHQPAYPTQYFETVDQARFWLGDHPFGD